MAFTGRIRERDLIVPTLQAAAAAPGGTITTSNLIAHLEERFQPSGEDASILDNRNDTKFSQIVRNLVSHKESSTSMFAKGYAIHDDDEHSITITQTGRDFLDQLPE